MPEQQQLDFFDVADAAAVRSPGVALPGQPPPAVAPTPGPAPTRPAEPAVALLGVRITDVTRARAVELIEELIAGYDGRPRSVFFVNAHTLNLAHADAEYRGVLGAADYVFGDGTGIRWAARMRGVRLRDNLNGTDLMPAFFRSTGGKGYRYFLLGGEAESVAEAARRARERFPGWQLAGFHHGYLGNPETAAEAIRQVNRAEPHVLLVGMGNPRQERWIAEHKHRLRVPVCIGVGGLLDFWAGKFHRAPAWIRRAGHEWVWRLLQDPGDKARRYLLGNPLFLARAIRDAWRARRSRRHPA